MATEKINDTRWALGSHTLKDIGSPSGEHTYRLVVSDPSGNTITAQTSGVTASKAADRNADQAGGVESGLG